jgi:hypothetical protein
MSRTIAARYGFRLTLAAPLNPMQANLPKVADSVAFFRKYCQPQALKGIKVFAPAVTNGGAPSGFAYLDAFLKQCTGCKIGGISAPWSFMKTCLTEGKDLHWYGSGITDLKNHIQAAIRKYPGREIWLTEFALNGNVLTTGFLTEATSSQPSYLALAKS